jgi:threonine synthase
MQRQTGFMRALRCRECGREYPLAATHVCEFDFGPLEVAYDYEAIQKAIRRDRIESRPETMWRYRELLPVAEEPTLGREVGFTPLIKADRLARRLGIRELVDQERRRELPDAFVQGPRGQRRAQPVS